MCDIWKIRQVREITEEDLKPHLESLRALKVKWVVFSGGEALMHSDLPSLCRLLRREALRLTLLTSGLSVERHSRFIAGAFDDVIVSIDGPAETHDRIRGIGGAYRQLERGMFALRALHPEMPIHGRCTVQKQNFRQLRATVWTSHTLMLDSLSFLTADLTSGAFNRPEGWSLEREAEVALTAHEADALDRELEALIVDCHAEIESGFIREKPEKLRRISRHFRSYLGQTDAVSPRCNAPWVSAVIEANGAVRPCFFHNPIGNIHEGLLADILNGEEGLRFRQQLDVSTNPTCRKCVCSLFVPETQQVGVP
jgi:MoaA/NifB/PqqE/SkfB family radical SAM enzyme